MEWIILIVVLLAARGSSAAVSPQQPRSILPVQQGPVPITSVEMYVPLNPNLDPRNQIAPGVFAPDQTRDTTSRQIHAIVSNGPTILQEQQKLLAMAFQGNGAEQGGQIVNNGSGRAVEGFE
jgi:hypothetical protein